jgi:hypothetical protein
MVYDYRLWMVKWIPCGTQFITADDIRWTDPVWERRPRKKFVKVGDDRIEAKVLAVESDRARLEVKISTQYKSGEVILRTLEKIGRGKPERMLWTDESARAIVASRHLGPEAVHRELKATARPTKSVARRRSTRKGGRKPPTLTP